jgi:hypothetical protein
MAGYLSRYIRLTAPACLKRGPPHPLAVPQTGAANQSAFGARWVAAHRDHAPIDIAGTTSRNAPSRTTKNRPHRPKLVPAIIRDGREKMSAIRTFLERFIMLRQTHRTAEQRPIYFVHSFQHLWCITAENPYINYAASICQKSGRVVRRCDAIVATLCQFSVTVTSKRHSSEHAPSVLE